MRVVSLTAAEIEPQNVRYAWEGRVPLAEPTILAGAPGLGKTQLAIGICARATTGKLPGDLHGQPVDVAYISAEDSLEYTLAPRFLAAGGDPHRIHFFKCKHAQKQHGEENDPSIQLPADMPVIDEWICGVKARILILDPFVALMPPALSSHKDQHVRRTIAPLAHMCHDRDLAAILVAHLNKDREAGALDRLSGSIGFGAAARSVLLFASDPEDPDGEQGSRRVLAHLKSNLGVKQPSIAYTIEQRAVQTTTGVVGTSIAVRTGDANMSAGDLLGSAASSTEANARTEAREFLTAELTDGPVGTTDLRKRAEDAGHNWRTVERAKAALNIRAQKNGKHWVWNMNTHNTPSIPPLVGVDGLVGVDDVKTDKADKTAGIEKDGGLDAAADDEMERLRLKFEDEA